MIYIPIKRLADGLVVLECQYGRQIWRRVTLRMDVECAICKEPIQTAHEAFSPLTDTNNRRHRICKRCIRRLVGPA